MASTKDYLDYVLEQLSGLDDVRCRAMMGEYILYYRGRVVGGVYDNRLLLKATPSARRNPEKKAFSFSSSRSAFPSSTKRSRSLCCSWLSASWSAVI